MPEIDRGLLIVLLIVGLVILVNIGLLYGMLSGSTRQQFEMLRRAAQRARNPWSEEDDDLKELRGRIARLQSREPSEADPDEPDG